MPPDELSERILRCHIRCRRHPGRHICRSGGSFLNYHFCCHRGYGNSGQYSLQEKEKEPQKGLSGKIITSSSLFRHCSASFALYACSTMSPSLQKNILKASFIWTSSSINSILILRTFQSSYVYRTTPSNVLSVDFIAKTYKRKSTFNFFYICLQ